MGTPYDKLKLDTETRPGGISISDSEYLPESIRNINLGPIRFKLLRKEESPVDWDEDFARIVEEEYRKFLTLAMEGEGIPTVASKNVDAFWHQHILDTEKYMEDMDKAFGHMVHHFPYLGCRGDADQEELQNQYQITLERYRKRFGEPPDGVWISAAHCGASWCSGNG